MATSATLQSYVASSMPRSVFRSHTLALPSFHSVPCRRLAGSVRVRCQAEEKQSPATPGQLPQTPPPKAKVSTKFSDVLAFSGPAPERINGRLAMIGFVSAIGVELASGNDLAAQLMNGGLPWFLWAAALFSAASLVPLFQGVSVQSKSKGLMTADAELLNGRFAMMGLVALAFTEFFTGGPLV